MQDARYKKTIRVYEKMGSKFIENIKDLVTQELYEFIDMMPNGGSALDVGCAGGRDSKVMLTKGLEVTGIDIVPKFIDFAKKDNPAGKFLVKDLLQLDFEPNTFDGIWAYAVLLHFSNDDAEKILNDFYKILKPHGKLFVGVKEGSGEKSVIDKMSEGKERYFNFFTKKQIVRYIEKAGFRILKADRVPDEAGRKDVKWIRVFAEKNNAT